MRANADVSFISVFSKPSVCVCVCVCVCVQVFFFPRQAVLEKLVMDAELQKNVTRVAEVLLPSTDTVLAAAMDKHSWYD